jgi:endonuclease/exonuclease/phosphatase (EEP) superfamily protein YafD
MRKLSLLAWLGWSYILLIALWLLLRWLFFDSLWWLALINTVAEYLFLPLPALLVASLWRRAWRLLLGLGLPIIAFVALFGALFLPKPAARLAGGQRSFTAMTFNVLTTNKDAAAIVGAIRAAKPDIVGFQELTRARKAAISAALEAEYPYHTLLPPERFPAVGLMSRFPIEHVERLPLPPLDFALHAALRVDGARLHVFVVHLSPNGLGRNPVDQYVRLAQERFAQRAAEVARLEQALRALSEPALLLCDCNLTDTSQAYARLATFMSDSFREAGWGFGHSSFSRRPPFQAQRLDYVWHSDRLVALEAAVGPDGGSDHRPVIARLALWP